ncbi:MAG: CoA transferase [Gammaproteobacteria bacterium]|nr:CoA transferase [Gammaproteobacteria bacterium]
MITPLHGYRVLDLTSREGGLCAQILGDLGADVIQIEPSGGIEARRRAPFIEGREDSEASLSWRAYARGKRSIVLDVDQPEDRQTILELIRRADFLVESEPVGGTVAGLDRAGLAALNPRLIHISITPFGSTGPRAHWQGSDIVVMAAGGPMAITGDDDRAPVRTSVPQAFQHAAIEGAFGALVALHERHRSGLGQHIDISAQQCVTICTQSAVVGALVNATPVARNAKGPRVGPIQIRLTYPASDGFCSITHIFGPAAGPATARLMHYVHDRGYCDATMRDKDWIGYGLLLGTGAEPIENFEAAKAAVAACTGATSKADLLDAAMERRLLLAPVNTMTDMLESPQLAARGYFRKLPGEAEGLRYPGPFVKFSQTPIEYTRAAPKLDAHRDEVMAELAANKPTEIPPGVAWSVDAGDSRPLAGLKVLDFMWAIAGPQTTRSLADFGATVVRIESSSRLDACRTVAPFMNASNDPEESALFHGANAGKLMLTLDLTKPEAKDVVFDLVRWADVVCESYSPRAMKAFGLDWEVLREINPKLIMLSTCLMGQTGPLALYAGFGNLAAAISGFNEVVGWPDREPVGPYGAYTDYIAPRYNGAAILAALEHRRRTGEGQYIDMSQAEAAVHFLAPAILDYDANGHVMSRMGNADLQYAPHGAYRTRGDDQWIAIACEDDMQWQALAKQMGIDGDDERFASAGARKLNEAALDALVSRFVADQDANALAEQLQSHGVPAYPVQNSAEAVVDPQLNHLRHFHRVEHPSGGHSVIEATRSRLSRTPGKPADVAPTFGTGMMDVLQGILGYGDEKVGELLVAGVLE